MERTEALGRKKKRASKIYDSKRDKWIENYDTRPKNKFKKKKKEFHCTRKVYMMRLVLNILNELYYIL